MLELFQNYLEKEKRYSAHTVLAYVKDVEQMFELLELNPNATSDLNDLNKQMLRNFIIQSSKNDLSAKSINRKLSSGRSFYKFLITQKVVDENPFTLIKGPKISKRLPEFVQRHELQEEKTESLFSDDIFGLRDKLIFELLYQTGIRLSELINMKESDVSTNGIRVLGKRNKERIIAISPNLYREILGIIEMKSQNDLCCEFLLFLDSGKKMYPKFVYRKINFYLSQLTTINKKSPHIMRHTFATQMLNEGIGIEVLKEILGHANLSATQVYTHNSFEQINSIYKSAHPRGHKT